MASKSNGSAANWRRSTVRLDYDDALLADFDAPAAQLPGQAASVEDAEPKTEAVDSGHDTDEEGPARPRGVGER